MDWDVVEHKLESLRHCLQRVKDKCPADAQVLAEDYDVQDILSLNLSRAVQLCVDIGAHLVSTLDNPPPSTMGQTFDILAQAGMIDLDLANKMKKAVGFRNLAVHHYDDINWAIVYAIARYHLTDFEAFAKAVINYGDGLQNR